MSKTNMMKIADVAAVLLLASLISSAPALAQGDPRSNVNLIGMTPDLADIPDTRYRQQNEPACAVRPGDSACIICAYNDYRAVDDLGDAWEGVSQSCDAGDTWLSRLAPGHPGDLDAELIPAEFAADPRLAAIPGMAIFNFIAGYRHTNVGVLAIQHWLEVNKEDADHYEPGRVTYFADTGTSGRFLDKPDMVAVLDDPDGRQSTISLTTEMENSALGNNGFITRNYPTGTLYVGYAVFTGSNSVKVLVKTSRDWGRTWKNQALKLSEDQNEVSGISLTAIGDNVLAVWRRRGDNNNPDSIMYSMISNGGKKATKGEVLADLCAFDQPTLTGTPEEVDVTIQPLVAFRTNDFPWTANDSENYYVFYSDRGRASDGSCDAFGRPRIMVHHLNASENIWTGPERLESDESIDNLDSFQFMPTAFGANGKVQVAWYDTRRETVGGAFTPWPFVADYSVENELFVQRTVDVYTTNVSMGSSGLNIPPAVRVSQYSVRVGERATAGDPEYFEIETEASLANKKMFAQGTAPFLGDYIALAAREFRRTDDDSAWQSNASTVPGGAKEDFFAAWADNRDVRGVIDQLDARSPYGVAALDLANDTLTDETQKQMLARTGSLRETGPPRDTSKTAEGVDGSDTSPGVCGPLTERTRDANIYGSLIKDQFRLYATTPSKPLSGLKRAFAMSLANAGESDNKYRLSIFDQSSNQLCDAGCAASFRQQSFEPTELLTVPAFSTAARTVFIDPLTTAVNVQAQQVLNPDEPNPNNYQFGPVIASIRLGNADQLRDPENCPENDPSCSAMHAETHQLKLQSLLGASLLNPALVARAVEGGCCEGEAIPTMGSVIEWATLNLDPDDEGDAALLNAALLNANLLNANLLNANLLNANLLNANLLNASPTDLSVLDPELLAATDGCCGSNPTVGDIIVAAFELANANLLNANLLNAALLNVNLLNANLLNADLLNANLLNANLLNAALLNANLLNVTPTNISIDAAALLNAALLNAALLNADLLNANLLNPTLVALALEGGCCDDPVNPATDQIITYAVANPDKINAALLNAALLNAALLNANLLNAALLNANLLNANLLNADLLNANLLNANLLNADLLNANLLNADLLNADLLNANLLNTSLIAAAANEQDPDRREITYDDYTYPVTNNGNVTTAINSDITINGDVIGTKLMAWTVNATPTSVGCEDRIELDTRVQSIVPNPDSILDEADINEPFNGAISTIAAPGETVFFTLRVIGTKEQLRNVRISGFTAAAQAADCRADGTVVNGIEVGSCEDNLRNDNEKITFKDMTPPILEINGPNPMTLELNVDTYEELGATAIDSVDGDISDLVQIGGDIVDTSKIAVLPPYSVIYNVIDSAGNFPDSETRTVTVQDTIAPVIELNGAANITLEAGVDTYTELGATVSDDGSPLTTASTGGDTVDPNTVGTYLVRYDANDGFADAIQVIRTVNVVDTIAPVINLNGAANITLEAGVDTYTELGATVSDDGSPLTTASTGGDTVDPNTVGTYLVRYDANDGFADAIQVIRTVNVVDTIAPVINLNGAANITLEAGVDTYTELGATVSDDGSPLTTASTGGDTVDPNTVGTYLVRYDANDGFADAIQVIRTVNVVDTIAPVINLNGAANITLEAGVDTYTELGATVSDDGSPLTTASTGGDTVDPNTVGTYLVRYDANDGFADAIQVIRTVNVVDTIAPVINLNGAANITLEAGVDTYTELGATVSDDGSPLTTASTGGDTVDPNTVGTYLVRYDANDGFADAIQVIRTVNVVDTTSPILPVYTNLTVQATSTSGTPVSWSETAIDIVDGVVPVSCSPASGSTFAIGGPTPVTCAASDLAGNPVGTSFNVTVEDTTAPVIESVTPPDGFNPDSPFPFQLTADENKLTLTWPVSVTDADPNLDVGCTIEGVDLMHGGLTLVGDQVTATFSYPFPVGDTVVQCTATDSVHPPTPLDFTVTILDVTAPVITVPADPLVIPSDTSPVMVNYSNFVSVYDAGYPLTEAVCEPASGGEFFWGDTPVTCNATDGSLNPADSAVFTVTVRYIYEVNLIPPKGRARAGSTVPLDWQYLDNGVSIDSSAFMVGVTWEKTDDATSSSQECPDLTPASTDGSSFIPDADSGNSDFRYSNSGNIWQFSWQTPDALGWHKVSVFPPGGDVDGAWACIKLR